MSIPSTTVILGVLASLANSESPDDADVIGSIPVPCGRHVLESLSKVLTPRKPPKPGLRCVNVCGYFSR